MQKTHTIAGLLTSLLLGAMAFAQSSPDALYSAGERALNAGQYTEAAKYFRQVVKSAPQSEEAQQSHVNLEVLAMGAGDAAIAHRRGVRQLPGRCPGEPA